MYNKAIIIFISNYILIKIKLEYKLIKLFAVKYVEQHLEEMYLRQLSGGHSNEEILRIRIDHLYGHILHCFFCFCD